MVFRPVDLILISLTFAGNHSFGAAFPTAAPATQVTYSPVAFPTTAPAAHVTYSPVALTPSPVTDSPTADLTTEPTASSTTGVAYKTDAPTASTPTAQYKIEMVVDQEVEEGSSQDTDAGPDKDVIMCIELSMATHMDDMVKKYAVDKKKRQDIVDPWELQKLTHHIDSDKKIVLYVKDDAKNATKKAVVKVFSQGSIQETTETPLLTSPFATTTSGGDKNATTNVRSLRRRRNRQWATDLVGDADCGTTCNPDDGDGGRRALRALGATTTFETYMGTNLETFITKDCADWNVTVSNTTFYQKF